jgi:predicted lipid carrier protein YhbT
MAEPEFPILLAGQSLTWLPAPLLGRATAILLRRLCRANPRLLRNLTAEKPSAVLIEPSDLPHRFVLRFGGQPPVLQVVHGETGHVDAGVKGPLAALIAMLEGRLDGDALFFSRTITVTGDSEKIVTLRNLVDREGLDVVAVAAGTFGPFEKLVRAAAYAIERRLTAVHDRVAAVHEGLHAERRANERPAAAPPDFRDLSARLARLEAKGRRVDRPAA